MSVNQVETHPFNQQIENAKFMKENNVQIESWAPFAEGKNNLFQNEILMSIAEKYNKSIKPRRYGLNYYARYESEFVLFTSGS